MQPRCWETGSRIWGRHSWRVAVVQSSTWIGGVYHSQPVRLQLVIQKNIRGSRSSHKSSALRIHTLGSDCTSTLTSRKNKSLNKWLPRSHQTSRVAPQLQPQCDCQKRRSFSSVCVQCAAPVVAINPNLTDTGSKSTFREPWKLTGEDSLPSPGLTSKPQQQWRLQRKTSTFGKNKETRRVQSMQDSSRDEEWPRVWIPKGHEY